MSTERPSRTAVTEQPPPRWQTTRRKPSFARSRSAGTRSAHHATEAVETVAPHPHSSRHRRGPRIPLPHPASSRGTQCRRRRCAGRREGRAPHRRSLLGRERCEAARWIRLPRSPADPGVDLDGIAETGSSVNDAMRDRIDWLMVEGKRVDFPRSLVVLDEVELQAGRAGVDDKDGAHLINTAKSSR